MSAIDKRQAAAAAVVAPRRKLELGQRLDNIDGQEGRQFLDSVADRQVEPADCLQQQLFTAIVQ